MKSVSRALAITAFALSANAHAATLLTYEFSGATGSQATQAATTVATGLTGLDMTRSGLGTNAGADSFNSTGWNVAGRYVSFGFNVTSGFSAAINQIVFGTRASNSGPGFVNLLVSIDGGAFSQLGTTITQNGTQDSFTNFTFAPLTAISSVVFRVTAANQTSANGGTVGSAGTLRIEDYSNAPLTVSGTVTAAAAAVPEVGTWAMMVVGFGLLGTTMRRRKVVFA